MHGIQRAITGNRQRLIVAFNAAVIAAIAFAAYANYFIQDDGFISLRYADHWARGYGPVWYPGSTEFGYTNFLFVALCAGLIASGVEPVVAAGIVSYSGFALAVAASYAIVHRLTRDPLVAALCVLVIFTNFTVSSYASGLLETSLQVGLVLSTYWVVLLYALEQKTWQCVAVAVIASFALLTRLDSSLLLLPAGLYVLGHLKSPRHLVIFLLIPTLIVGGFLTFCYLQYGAILPNTFYVKAADSKFAVGIGYLKLFLDADNFQYVVFAVALLATVTANTEARRNLCSWPFAGLLLAPAAVWTAYIVYVGGGFMGFRLMVPVIIFFFLAFFVLAAPFRVVGLLICLTIYAVLTSLTHYSINETRQASYKSGIQSPTDLQRHVSRPANSWSDTGKRLNALFHTGTDSDILIAVTAAGSIPFYSRLPTIDMLGLNDRYVALHGDDRGKRAGHRKTAPLGYLESRGVNLIIGHPRYICGGDVDDRPHGQLQSAYRHMPTVLVKISDRCSLITYYNHRHPRIDSLLEDGRDLKLLSELANP